MGKFYYNDEFGQEDFFYINAWKKIRKWAKENANTFEKQKTFSLPHNAYHRTECRIDDFGNIWVESGCWGWGNDEFIDCPQGKNNFVTTENGVVTDGMLIGVYTARIKELVDNWQYVKQQIINEQNKINSLKDFRA